MCHSQWDDKSKLIENAILTIVVLWTFILNMLVCEPGDRVTNQFEKFGVEFGQYQWYNLPTEMQRSYLLFLSDTQQLIHLQTYGGIMCTRETYKQVNFGENDISIDRIYILKYSTTLMFAFRLQLQDVHTL